MDKSVVIIVEGKHDMERVRKILPDIPILMTNGSALTSEFLERVKRLSKTHEIVLLLDPDYNGEALRKKIMRVCPDCSHVFVNKEDAISPNKKKVGVEHVPLDKLRVALKDIKQTNYKSNITMQDLFELGLVGMTNSRDKRKHLCDKLNIGYVNAKGLVERLNLFNYNLEDVRNAL